MESTTSVFHDELDELVNEIGGTINGNDLANQFDLGAIEQRDIERHLGIHSDDYINRLESDDMHDHEIEMIQGYEFNTVMTFRHQDDQISLKKHDDRVFMIVGSDHKTFEILFLNPKE